jgi:hypothetical protein
LGALDGRVQAAVGAQQTSRHSRGDSWDQPCTTVVPTRQHLNRQPPTQQNGPNRSYHRPPFTVARRGAPRQQHSYQHGCINNHPIRPPPAAYIPLGKPLSSNYTIPKRAPVPDPPAETTVFQRSNSGAHSATKPREEQRTQSVHSRADYYGPNPASTSSQHTRCEGCGRKGHTPDSCDRKEHPNWNPAHGHVLFADTAVGQAIAREAKGT